MEFLELLDKKAKKKNWTFFFLILLKFLSRKELKWKLDVDDQIQNTYCVILQEKGINGGLEAKISKINNTHYTISIWHHENINMMLVGCLMEENRTMISVYYKSHDNVHDIVEEIIVGEKNNLVKSRFKNLRDKLFRSGLEKT